MPLVFIHGVNARSDTEFESAVRARDANFRLAFRSIVPEPTELSIYNPYWGDLGAVFRWHHAALPHDHVESFGDPDSLSEAEALCAALLDGESEKSLPAAGSVVLTEARQKSMANAIDLLWAGASLELFDDETAGSWASVGALALNYALAEPHPYWLKKATNDQEFLELLFLEIEGWVANTDDFSAKDVSLHEEAFGGESSNVYDLLEESLQRTGDVIGRVLTDKFLRNYRERYHKNLAQFLGDVFVYLDSRGTSSKPGAIVQRILQNLDDADEFRRQKGFGDSQLYVVGHSLGGIIAYDILTHFRPQLNIEALVTVGSQVAVFEEMKLFVERDFSRPYKPGDRIRRPENIGRWINVFDQQDALGFSTDGVFAGTRDFVYTTGKPFWTAHSSYFFRPSFYRRMVDHLTEERP